MIPQRNISLLSNRLVSKGLRRISESVIERDYCLSWLLAGLAEGHLKDALLFKGGTAIKKCYVADYRFSEDLDFTLAADLSLKDIFERLHTTFDYIHKNSGIKFSIASEKCDSHKNSHTFYVGYEGPLPATSIKEIKVDVTIKEKIVFPIQNKKVLGYDEYTDLPQNARVKVYSLNEVAAEKTVALMDNVRNEPRDLYDIWYLTNGKYVDMSGLKEAVREKLDFRKKKLAEVAGVFLKKETRLKKLWTARLSFQMTDLPEFEGVYRSVKRSFRQAGLLSDI